MRCLTPVHSPLGSQMEGMTSADFPLPTLGPLLGQILQEVTSGRGFALVKGVPVQRWSRVQV